MIRALVIEDEPQSLAMLSHLLESFKELGIEVVGTAKSVNEALHAIGTTDPDLLFLDIELSGQTGFDLLQALPEPRPQVIFTTAYDQYALKAIKYSALDYLLKPIDPEELKAAVEKVVKQRTDSQLSQDSLQLLLQAIKKPETGFQRISLPSVYGHEIVNVRDIIRCDSEDHYTRFVLTNKKRLLVSNSLKYYEDLLPQDKFFRIHNSHLINIEHVVRVTKENYVVLSDESSAEISRRKKEAFMQRIGKV